MRALVTGSAGFIGRHVVGALMERGWSVLPIDLRAGLDMRRTVLTPGSIGHFDLVVHCAALVNGRETIDGNPAQIAAYNLQLDGALFEWALRARPGRIVYLSSSAAYPVWRQTGASFNTSRPLTEGLVCTPTSADATYGYVKCVGEMLAHHVRGAGVPVTVVRPFSGYGSDQDRCYPFPAMVARALARESPFDVWGDGRQVRDFVHVDDICAAVLALADAGVDGPVNIGTGVGTTMDELARMCMRAAGYQASIRHLGAKPSGVAHRVADVRRLHEHYRPTVTLAEGVQRAIDAGRPGSPENPIVTRFACE